MKDPRDYLQEIQANLRKLQSQGAVTPTENALFGMIDGLAGLHLVTMERVARLEQLLEQYETRVPPAAPASDVRVEDTATGATSPVH